MKSVNTEMFNTASLSNISASGQYFRGGRRFQRQLLIFLRALTVFLVLAIAVSCAKSVGATYDDASITTRVKTVFVNDPTVGVQRIDVDTFKGVVTLTGRVESKETEQKAIELARKIKGVVDVRSKVTIGG